MAPLVEHPQAFEASLLEVVDQTFPSVILERSLKRGFNNQSVYWFFRMDPSCLIQLFWDKGRCCHTFARTPVKVHEETVDRCSFDGRMRCWSWDHVWKKMTTLLWIIVSLTCRTHYTNNRWINRWYVCHQSVHHDKTKSFCPLHGKCVCTSWSSLCPLQDTEARRVGTLDVLMQSF